MTPLVGALATAAAVLAIGLLPHASAFELPRTRHPDAAFLADAGWSRGTARWEALRATSIVGGVLLATLLGIPWPAGLAAGLVPSIGARLRAQVARDRARDAFAQLLLAAQALLRSGIALPETLRRAAAGCDDRIARRPFEIALARFDLGAPLDEALRHATLGAADDRTAAALHTLALGVSERLPIERAASLVDAVAQRAVHERRLDAEVRARAAGVRTQTYLLAGVVPCLAGYLILTMPGLAATLSMPLGRTVLVPLAALLEVAGIVVSRRIVRQVAR